MTDMNGKRTKQTALCGIMAALSVVILAAGAAIGIGLYAAPMLASAVLIPVISECGNRAGILMFSVVCILSLMFVPDPEVTIVYIAFGWYPMAQALIYRLRKMWLRILAQLGLYAFVVAVPVRALYAVLGISELLEEGLVITVSLIVLGAVVFVLFDFVLLRARVFWKKNLKKKTGF